MARATVLQTSAETPRPSVLVVKNQKSRQKENGHTHAQEGTDRRGERLIRKRSEPGEIEIEVGDRDRGDRDRVILPCLN